MKKKLLLLSTIAAFALSLCGCDSKDDSKDDTKETVTTEATTEATTESGDISEQTEDAERGSVANGVFTNDVFKISFPVSDDWYICSDAEIAEIIGFTTENVEENTSLTVEQFEAATAGTVYDCVFYFSDMQSNCNITYTSLDRLGMYSTLPVMDYAEVSATQLESMSAPKYTADEPTTETYGGDEYACLSVATDQGYNQKMLMKKENGYMVMITLTYFPELESEMQSFLDSFTEVN